MVVFGLTRHGLTSGFPKLLLTVIVFIVDFKIVSVVIH